MADHSNDAAIRARAYQLWVESGHADGSQDQHWRQAEQEIAEREKAAQPGDGGGAADASRSQGGRGRHVDGVSTHPSVLDPGPDKGGA